MQRCTTCKGFKSIAPLGGIVKTCPDCSGIGYIESDKEINIDTDKEIKTNPIADSSINEQSPNPIKLDKRSKQYRAMVGR